MRSQVEAGGVLEHLAKNLRRLRLAAGLSQDELARKSGLSRRMVNGVEAGGTNISLANLDHVAAALNVAFVDLVQPPRQPHDSLRVLMWQSASQASQAVLLGAAPASRQVELWSWILAPGERYDAEPDPAGFSEMLYVLEGELQLELAAGTRTLATGDFFVFSSAQAYSYVNAGSSTLRFTRNVAS
ncbi:XRE family transcriptional regulator [Janthinobacterium sp. SUN026]|uniref:helix-turn-helix domain-containing protein n=1 Tax=Janthinobacterium sp. SUN026 TaxID=3002438 RepID=UPI0025AEF49C|nr:XRE family transcriptional regulator [Janthinobacterium sp. SUN026]MDN2672345.1 XRE family transcriptional regulator [Janthinobacterium sp. SUN026]